jgi:hypothetical protein
MTKRRRARKGPPPTIFQQMTADRARLIVYTCYADGVCCESAAEFREIQDGLRDPIRFALPGHELGDTWHRGPCDGNDGPVYPADPVKRIPGHGDWTAARANLSLALEALPEGHALLGPLLRADDAISDWLAVWRWARALAYHWGVQCDRYVAAIERHVETPYPPQPEREWVERTY